MREHRRNEKPVLPSRAAPGGSGFPHIVKPIVPEHEGLRRAVRWLSEQRRYDAAAIDEAARRFDLSPLDEQFLFDHFLHADRPPEPAD